MSSNDNHLPSLLDREVASTQADAFGHRDFADALQSLVESSEHDPPYSIGLLGKWGSGKSSVKSLYLSGLKDDRSANEQGRLRSEEVFPITFNAWRFGGEEIKRALLRHVYLSVGGDPVLLTDALFRRIQETVQTPRPWREILHDVFDRWIWSVCQLLVVVAGVAGLLFLVTRVFNVDNAWAASVIVIALAWLGREFAKYLFSAQRLLIPRYSSLVRVDEPRTSAEEYEELLIRQLAEFKKGPGRKHSRLVVFVDDLDRLSAEEMVSGLDAVRTFLEIPQEQLPTGLGIIFVISCDEDRVADALAGRSRPSRSSPDLPATVLDKSSARRYLDRIFQFRLEIPDLPKLDMRNFGMAKLKEELGDVEADLVSSGVSIETIIDRLIHIGVRSPRNAIQVLNAFSQAWWLAKRREKEGAGTERPGGLQEGVVTKHPIALAALCALHVNFPDFYNDLLADPNLITRFVDVFHREQELDALPESAQTILSRYQSKEGDLLPDHRHLRQYLVGLQEIRWPPSLQPLLLLAQDPVTRRFGDAAVPLYEAFVSGDHNELLRLVGRDKDKKPFSIETVRMLRAMVEDLHRETSVRRNNAAACLAAVADRLPKGQAHHLLSSLARRLADSDELRWRLGIEKIRAILPEATSEDRKDVASRLISDLLRVKGDVTFRLETMQPPSLDEASEMASQTCELMLWIRARDGLRQGDDEALLDWLELRRVSINGKEYTFPFSAVEEWMKEHESHLIPTLGSRYTEMAIAQLEESSAADIDIDAQLRRCRTVFDQLWDEGEESRATLWVQVTRLVSVNAMEGVQLAWSIVEAHPDSPEATALSAFISAFASRLAKSCEGDEEEWETEWEAGSSCIVSIVAQRRDDLNDATQESLANLASTWGLHDARASNACRVAESLAAIESEQLGDVVTGWIGRLRSDLPEECVAWIGTHYSSLLSDGERNQFVKQLQGITNKDDVTEDESVRYLLAMERLPREALEEEPLQGHLQNLCSQVQNRHNNPSDYLERIFPAVPPVLTYCPPGPAGAMLHTLFENAKSTPKIFGWLHQQMSGNWPNQESGLQPYNAEQVFNDALAVVTSHPNVEDISGALESANSMVATGAVEIDREQDVAAAACRLWPHDPETGSQVLRSLSVVPAVSDIAHLGNDLDANSDEDVEQLRAIWSYFVSQMKSHELGVVASSLIKSPAKGNDADPDLCLTLWLEGSSDNLPLVLQAVIEDASLNDEQAKRGWLQAVRHSHALDQAWFVEMLPVALGSNKPETVRCVIEERDTVVKRFASRDDQYKLGSVLLNSLVTSTSQETQNRLAEWLHELDAEAVLKEITEIDGVNQGHVDVLSARFPNSKHLKRIRVAEAGDT